MKALLAAILDDDLSRAKKLLKAERDLVFQRYEQAVMYESPISHWLYVGDTALHLAAAGHRERIVSALLAAGADVNAAVNHRRTTPLHYAADGFITGPTWNANRQVKTIRTLLDAGADINAQDKNGATPLHRAVRTRCAAAVACLLDAGADPTQKNKSGSTAFHLAVQNTGRGGSGSKEAIAAQRKIIQEFISRGVSIALRDGKRKSVADCARSAWVQELLAEKTA